MRPYSRFILHSLPLPRSCCGALPRAHATNLNYSTDHSPLTAGDKPRKRRPTMKPTSRLSGGVPESPSQQAGPLGSRTIPPITPQQQSSGIPPPQPVQLVTPVQSSPPKATPKTVVKALPTVRDHTTDQLTTEGDEYVPREYDEAGEKKITPQGHLTEGRRYKCKTFYVPGRGDKLFMLATECARVLGYRDSYLLFNKNRSLYKIIASQDEKEDLIAQDMLPFAYRSRQIAIVTAKSMFRQFGSRVIVDGRRVRDDYWETKARKQGFTEADLAGEKRPGGAKARDAAAAEANANASAMLGHQGDIVYSNAPVHFGHPQPQTVQPGLLGPASAGTPLPMITLGPDQHDLRLGAYRDVSRPRQEIIGPAYQDRTQTSPPAELLTQSQHAADYNKQINQQRQMRGKYMDDIWRQPHENPGLPSMAATTTLGESLPPVTQPLQSGRQSINTQAMQSNQRQSSVASSYSQSMYQQPGYTMPDSSYIQNRGGIKEQIGRSPSLSLTSANAAPGYGFANPSQSWAPPAQTSYTQFSPQTPSHASPPMQSPSLHQPPQMRQQPGMPYQGIQQSYGTPNIGRGMYPPDQLGGGQFMTSQSMQNPSTSQAWTGQQGGNQTWGWNPQG